MFKEKLRKEDVSCYTEQPLLKKISYICKRKIQVKTECKK